eukprot:tig00021179_g19233.t1
MCRGGSHQAPFFMKAYKLVDGAVVPSDAVGKGAGPSDAALRPLLLAPQFFTLDSVDPPGESKAPDAFGDLPPLALPAAVPSIPVDKPRARAAALEPVPSISPTASSEGDGEEPEAVVPTTPARVELTIEVQERGIRKRARPSLAEGLLALLQQDRRSPDSTPSLPPSAGCTPRAASDSVVETGYPFPVNKRRNVVVVPDDLEEALRSRLPSASCTPRAALRSPAPSPPASPCPVARPAAAPPSRAPCTPRLLCGRSPACSPRSSASWRAAPPPELTLLGPRASPLPAPAYAMPSAD